MASRIEAGLRVGCSERVRAGPVERIASSDGMNCNHLGTRRMAVAASLSP
ncbi:protein of unknown function [Thauera humireducens]|nr:protein of unknown function [Thauera humireducens]